MWNEHHLIPRGQSDILFSEHMPFETETWTHLEIDYAGILCVCSV